MSATLTLNRVEAARQAVRLLLAIADDHNARVALHLDGKPALFAGEPDVSHDRFADTIAQLRLYAAVVPA